MIETVLHDTRFRDYNLICLFLSLEHFSFEFVSDFDIRISYLNIGDHRSRRSQLTLPCPEDGILHRGSLKEEERDGQMGNGN
jgi:hypothetical protein